MAASRPIRCRSTSPPKRKPCLGNGHPRPFRSTNPGPLPESSMDADPQDSLIPSISHMSGHVSPVRARTIKEYDQEITELRRENFNLKLRLYFLEEKIDKKFEGDSREVHKINIQLNVEVQSLQSELEQKTKLLQEALGTLEKIEEKHRCELVDLTSEAEHQIMILDNKLSSLQLELQKCQSRESETDGDSKIYKQAFGLEDASLQSFCDPKLQGKNWETEIEELNNLLSQKEEELVATRQNLVAIEEKYSRREGQLNKRNKALQGILALLQSKEREVEKLKMQIRHTSKGYDSDNFDSQTLDVLEEVDSENSSSEATISTDRKGGNSPNLLNEIKVLKKELKRKQNTIKALEEALSKQDYEQQIQINGSQETDILSEETEKSARKIAALDQECQSLHQAIKEKDIFIQELLTERSKAAMENEKSVRNLLASLQNKDSIIHDLEQRNNGYMTDWSEELKALKEQLIEKDNDLSLRIQTINTLKHELLQNKSKYETASSEAEHNYQQFLEVAEEKDYLSQQLLVCEKRLQDLLGTKETTEMRLKQCVFAIEELVLQLSREKSELNLHHEVEEKDRKLEAVLRELKAVQSEQQLSASSEKLLFQKPEQLSFDKICIDSQQEEQLKEQLKQLKCVLREEKQSDMLSDEYLHKINKKKDNTIENQDVVETLSAKFNDLENIQQKELNSSSYDFNKANDELEKVYFELDNAQEEINKIRSEASNNLEKTEKDALINSLQQSLCEAKMKLEQQKGTERQFDDKIAYLEKDVTEKDNLKVSLKLKVKSKDVAVEDQQLLLIQKMELEKEQYEKKEIERELHKKETKIAQLQEDVSCIAIQAHEKGLMVATLQEENSRLLNEINDKTQELDLLTTDRGQLEEQTITLQGKLHQAAMRVNELEKIVQDSRLKLKVPRPCTSVLIQTDGVQQSPQHSSSLDILSLLTSSHVYNRRSKSMEDLPQAHWPTVGNMSDHARHSLPVSFRPEEQQSSPSSRSRCLMSQSLTHFGHSDSVKRLKEEICVLVLRLERAEQQLQIMQHEKIKLEQYIKVLEHEQTHLPDTSKFSNPRIVEVLHHHLEQEVEFLERLLLYEQTGKLNCSALTPEEIAQFRKRLVESRELSQSLSASILGSDISSMFEETISASAHGPSVDPNLSKDPTLFLSKTRSQETEDSQAWMADGSLKEDSMDQTEGRETRMVSTGENRKQSDGQNQSSQRHQWSLALQHQPISEWIAKEQSHFDQTEQLVVLEASDSDDILLLLNDQGLPENVYLRSSWQQRSDCVSKICQIQEIKEKSSSKDDSSVNDSSKISKCLNHRPNSVLKEPINIHLVPEKSQVASASDKATFSHSIQNLSYKSGLSPATKSSPKPYHAAQPSSDSDIWSEPDRNISLQRIGMDLKAIRPKFQRRGNASFRLSDHDYTSEYSSHLPSSSKGKGRLGTFSGYHGSKHKIRDERLESRLSNIEERSEALDAKLTRYFDMSDQIRCHLSELLVTKEDHGSVKMLSDLKQYLEQLCCHQKTVADAVKEWGALKGKKIAENETQTSLLFQESQNYKESISDEVDSGEDLKITLVKEKMARRQAEKQLADYCHEIEICHQTINNLNLQLQERDMEWRAFREKISNTFEGRFGSDPDLHSRVQDRYANLIQEIGTLQGRLISEQDRVRKIEQEKTELERKLCYESNENKQVQEWVKKLQDENLHLKHELSQFQDKFITTDKMCLHLKEDLQQAKEKLERILEKCGKLESDLVEESSSKTELSNKNKTLEEKLNIKHNLLQNIEEQKYEIQTALKEKDDYSKKLKTENDNLKDQMLDLKQQIEKVTISLNKAKEDKESLQEQVSSLKQQVKEKENLLKNVKKERDDIQNQLFPLQQKLEEQKLSWKSVGEEKNVYENQVTLLEKQIKKNDAHRKQLEEKLEKFQDEISELQLKVKEKEALSKKHEEEKDSVQELLTELQRDMRKKECSQKQTKQKVQELEDQNYELKQQLEEINVSKKKAEEENGILHEQVSSLQQLLKKAEFTQKKLEKASNTLQDEISELNHHIEEKDCSLKSLEKERDNLQSQLADLKHEMKKKETLWKKVEKERNCLQDYLSELEWQVKEKDLHMKKIEEENSKIKNNISKQEEELKENKSLLKQIIEDRDFLRKQIFQLEKEGKEPVCSLDQHEINAKQDSNEQIIALQNSVYELQQQLKGKESYAEKLQKENKSLESHESLKDHYSPAAVLETENDISKLSYFKSRISHLEKELKDKEINLKELQEERDKFYSQIADGSLLKENNVVEIYEQENYMLHLKVSTLEKQLKDHEFLLSKIKRENMNLQNIAKNQNLPSVSLYQQKESLSEDKIGIETVPFKDLEESDHDNTHFSEKLFHLQPDLEKKETTSTEHECIVGNLKREISSLSSQLRFMEQRQNEQKAFEQNYICLQQQLESKQVDLTESEEKIIMQSKALLSEQLKIDELKKQFEEKIMKLMDQIQKSELYKISVEAQLSALKQQLHEKEDILNITIKEKSDLQNCITELTLKLKQDNSNADNDTLLRDKVELTAQLNKIQNDKDDLSRQYLELKQHATTLESYVTDLQMDLCEKESALKQLNEKFAGYISSSFDKEEAEELTASLAKISELEEQLKKKDSQLNQIAHENMELHSQFQKQTEIFNSDRDDYQNEICELQNRLHRISEEKDIFQNDLIHMKSLLKEKETEVQNFKTENDMMHNQILNSVRRTSSTDLQQIQRERDALQNEVAFLQRELQTKKSHYESISYSDDDNKVPSKVASIELNHNLREMKYLQQKIEEEKQFLQTHMSDLIQHLNELTIDMKEKKYVIERLLQVQQQINRLEEGRDRKEICLQNLNKTDLQSLVNDLQSKLQKNEKILQNTLEDKELLLKQVSELQDAVQKKHLSPEKYERPSMTSLSEYPEKLSASDMHSKTEFLNTIPQTDKLDLANELGLTQRHLSQKNESIERLQKEKNITKERENILEQQLKERDDMCNSFEKEIAMLRKQLFTVEVEMKELKTSRNEDSLKEELKVADKKLEKYELLIRSMQIELKTYEQLSKKDGSPEPTSEESEAINKSLLMELLGEIRQLRGELEKVYRVNNHLRRKLEHASVQKMLGVRNLSKELKTESSSEQESQSKRTSKTYSEGTLTFSRAGSLSQSSLESTSVSGASASRSGSTKSNRGHHIHHERKSKKEKHASHPSVDLMLETSEKDISSKNKGPSRLWPSESFIQNQPLSQNQTMWQGQTDVDIQPTRERDMYFVNSLKSSNGNEIEKLRHDKNQDSVIQRSHYSSPDLGIESDPNHDISANEVPLIESIDNRWPENGTSQYPAATLTVPATLHGINTNSTQKLPQGLNSSNAEERLKDRTSQWTFLTTTGGEISTLHAIARLEDYELLKKEIQESEVGVKGIVARVKDRLLAMSGNAVSSKSLEYSTLKAINSSCHNVEVCLGEAVRLIACFWVTSFPSEENLVDWNSLLGQNIDLREELSKVRSHLSFQTKELQQAMDKLTSAERRKKTMEKAITKQLTKTEKVLKLSKSNLQHHQEQKRPSSHKPT